VINALFGFPQRAALGAFRRREWAVQIAIKYDLARTQQENYQERVRHRDDNGSS
jgi:hypothetical protein